MQNTQSHMLLSHHVCCSLIGPAQVCHRLLPLHLSWFSLFIHTRERWGSGDNHCLLYICTAHTLVTGAHILYVTVWLNQLRYATDYCCHTALICRTRLQVEWLHMDWFHQQVIHTQHASHGHMLLQANCPRSLLISGVPPIWALLTSGVLSTWAECYQIFTAKSTGTATVSHEQLQWHLTKEHDHDDHFQVLSIASPLHTDSIVPIHSSCILPITAVAQSTGATPL